MAMPGFIYKVAVRRLAFDGIYQIRTIRKSPESMPLTMQWPDGLKAQFKKISKGGYAYYQEYL